MDSEARSGELLALLGHGDLERGEREFASRLEPFVAYLNVRNRSEYTIESYTRSVKHLWSWLVTEKQLKSEALFDLGTFTPTVCSDWKDWLLARYRDDGRATVVIKIAATNAFLDFLSELPKNSDVRPPKKISSPTVDAPQVFMIDDRDMELMQLAASDPSSRISHEARAFFWVAVDTWQRVGSVTNLLLRDLDLEHHRFSFRASKMKQRRALVLDSICEPTFPSIMAYVREVNPGFQKELEGEPTYLFPAMRSVPIVQRGGSRRMQVKPLLTKPMGKARPTQLLMEVAEKAGTSKGCRNRLHMHALRRWAITRAWQAGMSPSEIASRSGHHDLTVLQERYIRPEPNQKKFEAAIMMVRKPTESGLSDTGIPEQSTPRLDSEQVEFARKLRKLLDLADKL